MKSQAPSTKLQTNLKFQYSMTKTGLEFGILVIVICLMFDICDLEFLFLQYSKNNGHAYRQIHSTLTWRRGPGFLGLNL